MGQKETERRLAAIVAVDVAGYSRLMGADEEGTLSSLQGHRAAARPLVENHGGRLVGTAGDSLLLEFPSAVEAVASAIAIQDLMRERNQDVPDDRKMLFRIGVNLGDVLIAADGDIYGDGVNVAARIEALAEPGDILLSEDAYRQVRGRRGLQVEDLGEKDLKNIDYPVRVYRVDNGSSPALSDTAAKPEARSGRPRTFAAVAAGVFVCLLFGIGYFWWQQNPATPNATETASEDTETYKYPLPERPSLAVLAFDNLSADPAQDYFSDGFTDDLITDLSKLRGLFVIARNSSFAFKGRNVDIRQIGRELGVRYVMEGSIRKVGDQIRITAQLIDATSGKHIWAERYDQGAEELLSVNDDIRGKIVAALDVKLSEGEQSRKWRRSTTNPKAYDLFLRGREHYLKVNKADAYVALDLLKEAVEIDPDFAAGWLSLGWVNFVLAGSGWVEDPRAAFEQALAQGAHALELDPQLHESWSLQGYANIGLNKPQIGLEMMEKAVALDPNSAKSAALLAGVLPKLGRTEEAKALIEKALRINPDPPLWYLLIAGRVQLFAGDCAKAIDAYEKCIAKLPDFISCQRDLAVVHMALGQKSLAAPHVRAVLRIDPGFKVSNYDQKTWAGLKATKDDPDPLSGQCKIDGARRIWLLYQAGLPE